MKLKNWLQVGLLGFCYLTRSTSYEMKNEEVNWKDQELSPGTTVQAFKGTPVKTKIVKLQQDFYKDIDAFNNRNFSRGLIVSWSGSSAVTEEAEHRFLWSPSEDDCKSVTLDQWDDIRE